MPDDSAEPAKTPWFWPGQWVREEKFWRDIGTRVLAGVLTAAIIYLGALLLGYLHTPEIGAGLLLALGIAGGGILVAIGVALLGTVPSRLRADRPFIARIVTAAILFIAAVALVLAIIADIQKPDPSPPATARPSAQGLVPNFPGAIASQPG